MFEIMAANGRVFLVSWPHGAGGRWELAVGQGRSRGPALGGRPGQTQGQRAGGEQGRCAVRGRPGINYPAS